MYNHKKRLNFALVLVFLSKHFLETKIFSGNVLPKICQTQLLISYQKRSIGKRGHGRRTPDKRWKRRTTMEKTDKRWKRRTNDGKDGQTMEKTDKRWKRRTNDGKDAFSNRPTFHEYI